MQLLGGDHRKAFAQIKAHLVAEHRTGAGAGAVRFIVAMLKHMPHQIKVLFHAIVSKTYWEKEKPSPVIVPEARRKGGALNKPLE